MSARAIFSLFSMELRKIFSYRVDFWVQFLGTLIVQFVVAWFLWSSVFRSQGLTQVGGYSFHELMFYYLLVPLVDRLNRGYDNFVLSREIYDGSLTRYLLYPLPFFGFKYVGQIARAVISFLQLMLGFIVFAAVYGLPESYHAPAWMILSGFALCGLAGLCYFFLAAMIEMVAFWADNVWSLMVMLRFLIQMMGGALLPLELYPQWARDALMLTPFPHLLAVPVRFFMGHASLPDLWFSLGVLSGWTLVFWIGCRLVWRAGTKGYTGVGI